MEYLSRIPAYNEDVEEPWYWGVYGQDLYEYSFYMDRYNTLHNQSDLLLALQYEAMVSCSSFIINSIHPCTS